MSKIFVSYRRGDTAAHAGRLTDRLRQAFGANNVFMDVTTLEPGVDFVEAIQGAVGKCEILIVVIGKDWVSAVGGEGQRRLDDPDDFVRLETAAALTRSIRVVPVLVERAEMPRAQDLPDVLKPLVRRNAFELRDTRWDADVDALLHSLAPRRPSFFAKPQVWSLGALGAAGVLAAAIWWPRGSDTSLTHEPESAQSARPPAPKDEPEAAQHGLPQAPQVAAAQSDAPVATATTTPPSMKLKAAAAVSSVNVVPLLLSVCPPKTAKTLYDFALPPTERRGTWVWDKKLFAVQTDAAERNPCGGSSVLRLKSLADTDIDVGLDLTNTPGRDWRNRKAIHLALRSEAMRGTLQIYVVTSNYGCTAEWTQAAPKVTGGTWSHLSFGLTKHDSNGPHRKDPEARCQLELGDVSLIGVKLFGAKADTTLSLGQLWLD